MTNTEPNGIARVDGSAAGCYVDGHYGQYATARMVQVAEGFGYANPEAIRLADSKLAAMMPAERYHIGLTPDDEDALVDYADAAEAWLNEHVASDGYVFEWVDGEFYYSAIEHDWAYSGQIRSCWQCGTNETYWDDEEYPINPCHVTEDNRPLV